MGIQHVHRICPKSNHSGAFARIGSLKASVSLPGQTHALSSREGRAIQIDAAFSGNRRYYMTANIP
jgi:hypothetical protein